MIQDSINSKKANKWENSDLNFHSDALKRATKSTKKKNISEVIAIIYYFSSEQTITPSKHCRRRSWCRVCGTFLRCAWPWKRRNSPTSWCPGRCNSELRRPHKEFPPWSRNLTLWYPFGESNWTFLWFRREKKLLNKKGSLGW